MILTINGGSSSIKFALFELGNIPEKIYYGQLTRVGTTGTRFIVNGEAKSVPVAATYQGAIDFLVDWLEENIQFSEVKAIGHRIVHGMQHTEPGLITDQLLKDLKIISGYDPDHLPYELQLIEGFKKDHSDIKQYACFDTAFIKICRR